MTETEALLALNMLPKIGPVRVRRLIAACGSAAAVLAASRREFLRVHGIGEESAAILAAWQDHCDVSGELQRISDGGYHILTPEDETWPEGLRHLHDAPLLLYVWGKVESRDRSALGIVGSRRATSYGLQQAKRFGFQLAHAGVTVLSGLARGIDTAAHEGAVAAQGRTIAVIGAGLGHLYPPENMALAERIAHGHGAVVSEFPILTPPDKQTFPQRNRIVSGWSHGILVVEAPAWSGALITANNAADQGRSLYAIPGPIDRPSSTGCNRLIQNGARLVMDASEILEDLQLLIPASSDSAPPPTSPPLPDLSEPEQAIWNALAAGDTQIDQLTTATGLPPSEVAARLTRMELRQLVRQLPGRIYSRATL